MSFTAKENFHWIGADPFCFPEFQKTNASWFDHKNEVHPAMMIFRRVITMDAVPPDLKLIYTGDCKFRIFINGTFFDDGPVEAGGDYGDTDHPDWWFAAIQDAAFFFRPGANVIVVHLLNVPEAQTDYSAGHTGLSISGVSDGKELFHTDQDWKCSLSPAYVNPNTYNASREISPDYFNSDFDDSTWVNAAVLPGTVSRIWKTEISELPALTDTPVAPVKIRLPFQETAQWIVSPNALLSEGDDCLTVLPGPPVTFYLEFASEVFGHLEFEVESSGGAVIDFDFQEVPDISCGHFKYSTAYGRRIFRTTKPFPVQYLKVTVSCSQFGVETNDPVKIHTIRIRERTMPGRITAAFKCSDPALNQLHDNINRTMRLCAQRLHLDSPVHQEGLGCTGDYMIESLMEQAMYGDVTLTKADILRTVYRLKQTGGILFHTSYSLLFVDMVRDWFLWTGDTEFLNIVFPALESILMRFRSYTGKTGLISNAPNYMFIDWIADGGSNYHHPPAERGMGCMTAFYFHALETAAALAEALGKPTGFASAAATVREAFVKELWDSEKQCFRDGIPHLASGGKPDWCPPDQGRISYSVHTNALALAYGLVPKEKRCALLDKIMTDKTLLQPQPYFCHFVFEALHVCEAFGKYGYDLLKRWNTLLAEHPASLKECWNCGDYSHAWGGTPAYQITRSIFGVEPLVPRWGTVRIAPEFGPLTSAEGEVPTPQGPVRIKWDGVLVKVALPSGITARPGGPHKIEFV